MELQGRLFYTTILLTVVSSGAGYGMGSGKGPWIFSGCYWEVQGVLLAGLGSLQQNVCYYYGIKMMVSFTTLLLKSHDHCEHRVHFTVQCRPLYEGWYVPKVMPQAAAGARA